MKQTSTHEEREKSVMNETLESGGILALIISLQYLVGYVLLSLFETSLVVAEKVNDAGFHLSLLIVFLFVAIFAAANITNPKVESKSGKGKEDQMKIRDAKTMRGSLASLCLLCAIVSGQYLISYIYVALIQKSSGLLLVAASGVWFAIAFIVVLVIVYIVINKLTPPPKAKPSKTEQ